MSNFPLCEIWITICPLRGDESASKSADFSGVGDHGGIVGKGGEDGAIHDFNINLLFF